jgi:hypothetical protein
LYHIFSWLADLMKTSICNAIGYALKQRQPRRRVKLLGMYSHIETTQQNGVNIISLINDSWSSGNLAGKKEILPKIPTVMVQ